MQKILHRAKERGEGEHGWLHSRFSFSFADWYEPNKMGFGALRVWNDDVIEPSSGFPMHAHKDMEIITIVLEGAVTHKDSMDNVGVVNAGEVQVMSAGTGVTHSEYNASPDQKLKLFQLWIQPKTNNVVPQYAQYAFPQPRQNYAQELVSPIGGKRRLMINQDAYVSRMFIDQGATVAYDLKVGGNGAYIFVVDGAIEVAGEDLGSRDAIGLSDVTTVKMEATQETQVLIVEVPMSA